MDIPPKIRPLWDKLSEFVKDVCMDRDESHGHLHMEKVAINSLKIYKEMTESLEDDYWMLTTIIITAWLHDVADHKYDVDNKLKHKIHLFLEEFYYNDPDTMMLIEDIIDRISFSKENKALINNELLDWEDVLGEKGCIIRDIVSDADKLEAIGKDGLDRCIMFTRESNPELKDDEIINKVKKHSHEKLLRLKDEFIRTIPGKKMADPLHNEMLRVLACL